MSKFKWKLLTLVVIGLAVSCSYTKYVDHTFRKNYSDFNELITEDDKNPFLKVHLKNGDLVIFNSWDRSMDTDSVSGFGNFYNFQRYKMEFGYLSVHKKDVALYETNDLDVITAHDSEVRTAMTLLAAFDVAIGVACLVVPKACFGSCPTFYFDPDEEVQYANAEGFSNAIAPSLQQSDLDALNKTTYGGTQSLYVKNEALETHVIDYVGLEVIPIEEGQRAYQYDDKRFLKCTNPKPFSSIVGGSENIEELLVEIDGEEYFSATDSFDLSTKEEISLKFKNTSDFDKGLVLNYRQTLLTTYLIYEALSLTGDECGRFVSMIENDANIREEIESPFDILGALEVLYWNEKRGRWIYVDELYETGPIARNQEIIPLPFEARTQEILNIKLRFSKGLWRLDYAGITDIINADAQAKTINVSLVTDNKTGNYLIGGELDEIDGSQLVTLPTDEYKLDFELPDLDQKYELFLNTNGYYLEWVRKEWTEEKDLKKLRKLIRNDKKVWREIAVDFKKQEADMERLFWSSKVEYLQ